MTRFRQKQRRSALERSFKLEHGLVLACAIAASAAGLATASAQTIPTIRVGWTVPAEDAKYWMMKRPQEFPNLGKKYNVEWVQFQGTAQMVQAMAAGALDCSTQGVLSLAQGAASAGLQTYIVAQHVGEKAPESFSVYWAVKDDSPIKSVKDFKGKTIGLNVLGTGIWGPLAIALKKNGIDPDKDVKLVEAAFPTQEDAIRTGRLDIGVLNQPFAARAEAKGGLRKVFSISEEIPDIVHILEACSKTFVDKNPELAALYVEDLTAGMGKALANRDETLKIVTEIFKAPVQVFDPFYFKTRASNDAPLGSADFARDPGAAANYDGIQAMFKLYYDVGMLPKQLDVKDFKHAKIFAPLKP
ncbi:MULTISPECIES: ABC transporter substrate-binding protein [unclassified Chelatococcus]|uniref:ABC transporter substrate-binding protein n=1 Tax=unclassified Chelatococcus TaxID=2638111 RepID=UPI001BCD64AB|nr:MULTISPECIES: ABC transporter substrate-binding protein [unclassified Chelatococcus]CAH1650138.1 Alkanesulfonates-binding protein [Hyphomicrobiales bacterium]MBS7743347.1 ABC transporter substrate-binding protein [Chelatococcus sp. HY11]MBX3541535.1 ABC transporter substrate-binding protein [Chelatococcus sp.]MCO5074573.1 ABC transporter substrate-binding protein [Chelatococcus sp.]CAH1692447.1 Alkanesulfonates-binding protein [Hyphomicrobiales bacterium]